MIVVQKPLIKNQSIHFKKEKNGSHFKKRQTKQGSHQNHQCLAEQQKYQEGFQSIGYDLIIYLFDNYNLRKEKNNNEKEEKKLHLALNCCVSN